LDVRANILYKSGKKSVQECYYGSSYLSQSGRFLLLSDGVKSVEIINSTGGIRKLNL